MVSTITTLLERAGTRRSIENPAVPLSDIDLDHPYASSLTGGVVSTSGVVVDSVTALTASAVWRGVNLIAGMVAKTPLHCYRRLDGEGKERADTLVARLIRRKANPYMTAFDLKQTLTAHALLTGRGNGYAYIFRKNRGDPTELLPLDPLATYPVRENGVLWYVTAVGTEQRKLPAADVLHIRGLSFDGLVGYDVLHVCKDVIGGAIGTRRYGNAYFKNSARPNVVLEYPKQLGRDAKRDLRKSWEAMHQGLHNAHKTAVLEYGVQAKVLADNARQSILIDAQKIDFVHVANVLGLPVHKVGGEGRTAYASLEQENRAFLDDCLDPWLCRWENECYDKLLSEQEKAADSHFFEFTRDALIQADTATLVAALVNEVNNGLLNPDEARAIRNRPPLPNGMGAKFRMPKNHVIMGEEDDAQDAQRTVILEAARRMHKRICIHARKAARKPDGFVGWLDEGLDADHRQVFIAALGPAVRVARMLSWSDTECDAQELADTYFADVRDSLLTAAECQPSELAAAVEAWVARTAESTPESLVDRVIRRRVEHEPIAGSV